MNIQNVAALAMLGLLVSSPAQAQTSAVDAVFERTDPAAAVMTLTEEGEEWRITFSAGGIPNGAATAADCELEAMGPQDVDGIIAARIVPFDSELNTVTSADIGTDTSEIQVNVGPEGAFVTDGGAAARYCALGSDIDGFYVRTGTDV